MNRSSKPQQHWIVPEEESLQERLRYEMLLSEISARFINLPADRIEDEVKDAQRRICELLDLDRFSLWQTSKEEPQTLRLTHLQNPPQSPTAQAGLDARDYFPWSTQKALEGETVPISKLSDLPPEADRDRESYRSFGTKSAVVVPLSVGNGPVLGLVSFAVLREERNWSETVVQRFKLIAQVFANALARRESSLKLEEQLGFQILLAEISARFVNLPPDQVDGEVLDAQRRICELLGLDLAALWQSSGESPDVLTPTHVYVRENLPAPGPMRQEQFPWYLLEMAAGRTVVVPSLESMPAEAAVDRETCRRIGVKSNLTIPLSAGGKPPIGILGLNTLRADRAWPEPLVKRLQLVAQVFANALIRKQNEIERKQMEERLRDHVREIEGLKERLERENVYLQEEIKLLVEHTDIVGQSDALKRVLAQVEQVARTDSTVLLLGETGTGKELLARAIHSLSSRKGRPLVTVNCAALPPTLIESELFGREKGAYTGALTRMVGRFEIADKSTLFLDEIGELPLELQGKLLRVLEEGNFERLGSPKPVHVDVRIIAATNREIEQEVQDGRFRRDLFYRLNVFPIVIPPLRERPEDIPLLVRTIVKEFEKKMGKEIESIPRKTMQALQAYAWPGNVRELRNVIEHAMILCRGNTLFVHVPKGASSEIEASGSLQEVERMHVVAVLEKAGWRIGGPGGAAEILGLKRTTLLAKMKKLGIQRSTKPMSD